MGSRISRVVRPRKAAPAPAREHSTLDNAANAEPRQDPARLVSRGGGLKEVAATLIISSDDLDLPSTRAAPTHRRNSTPSPEMSVAARHEADRPGLFASFEEWFAGHLLRNIDYTYDRVDDQNLLPPIPPPPPAPLVQPEPVEVDSQCLVCCEPLPKEADADYSTKVMQPCRSCESPYCTACVKKMFTDACNDMTRMPPRCCVRINLHQARSLLTDEEAALFKAKFEEWSTPKPFYCPVPVCSAFIPERLLPQQTTSKGKDKQRVDSGIGTPTPNTFACPTCTADICANCRQVAHPDINCEINDFGADDATAALLISWGYKKCPKCGHGVKRMYGCSHMECRCGAHFCWVCLQNRDSCDGGCYDSDEDYDDQYEPDEEDDENDEDAPTSAEPKQEEVVANLEEASTSPEAAEPQPARGPKNLDGGSPQYWEEADLDFGEEPSNDIQDQAWDCHHSFLPYSISLAKALTKTHGAHDMECEKCWSIVHPTIDTPYTSGESTEKMAPAGSTSHQRTGIRRTRARYTPPRGLFRADATIGTAPHLTTQVFQLSQSLPSRASAPMDDVQFSDRIVDTYGNIITATPLKPTVVRRASTDDPALTTIPQSNIFSESPAEYTIAHECRWCHILLCDTCKDISNTKREEEQKEREREREEEEQRERAQREEQERLQQEEQTQNDSEQTQTQDPGQDAATAVSLASVTEGLDPYQLVLPALEGDDGGDEDMPFSLFD